MVSVKSSQSYMMRSAGVGRKDKYDDIRKDAHKKQIKRTSQSGKHASRDMSKSEYYVEKKIPETSSSN